MQPKYFNFAFLNAYQQKERVRENNEKNLIWKIVHFLSNKTPTFNVATLDTNKQKYKQMYLCTNTQTM